jgi:DNA-binding IclR family transcriptional regulator
MSSATVEVAESVEQATPTYHVPALEKGLDILECLAAQGVPLTQAQLARALGRGASELFRMLTTLERRGYVQRDPISGAYGLTLRLYELGHAHSPSQGLLRAAERPMRDLTEELRQSCHLSVIQRGRLLVLHQEESPAPIRLSVEVGGSFPLLHAVSGRLLLASLDDARREETLLQDDDFAALTIADQTTMRERLALIRERGYDAARSETIEGVSDLAVLVGGTVSRIQAALAIAAPVRHHETFVDEALPALLRCADATSRAAGLANDGRRTTDDGRS